MSTTQSPPRDFDVLIIGSGAAGLTLALQLPEHLKIALLSKGSFESGSTWLAQGRHRRCAGRGRQP